MIKLLKFYGRFISSYYRGFDHPFKLRIIDFLNKIFVQKLQNKLIIPYVNKTWISVNTNDYVGRVLFQKGLYEQEVFDALMQHAVANEILWDIGAHIGSFTLKALNFKSVNEIHCFEPNPATFALLRYNIEINNCTEKVKLHDIGLGDKEALVPFQPNQQGNSGGSKFIYDNADTQLNLQVTTIDNLVFTEQFNPPTLMKIDVEGFEEYIFRGGQKLFKTHPPKCIVFETNANGNLINNSWINNFLISNNYIITFIDTTDGLGSSIQNFVALLKPNNDGDNKE